jgi:two-component system NtrC family sensor kinase
VAFRWRIRHKLMLGLGLVVGIIAVLLAGALYGLWSYRATMKSIESKLVEQTAAEMFKSAVHKLKEDTGNQDPASKLLKNIEQADRALDSYEEKLRETLIRGRDPDKGLDESTQVGALRTELQDLKTVTEVSRRQNWDFGSTGSPRFVDLPEINKHISILEQTADDLLAAISGDVKRRIQEAKGFTRNTLWLVFSTSILGTLLLCSLLRFFYAWVFYPIRDLEQGAGRVAQGDFEHRIEVHSGDELEDLAAAFNNMTGRLQEIYRDLARQVNERSRQLVRSERLASVGFLAAGVAHEINNPLASIAFCSEALEKRLTPILDASSKDAAASDRTLLPPPPGSATIQGEREKDREQIAKYLKMIQEEAFRCKAITQRLLEFSRGSERRREPTDLVDLTQSVLDMVQHLPNSRGKKIIFQPTAQVRAWVNAQEIKPVVLNLVVNALDSMDEDGTLTVTVGRRDTMAEMIFADTGCGMSGETLENLFEPFFTRSRTGKGTGLGLSISHRVISQHGGEIDAFSAGPNQGSTFTVRLPIEPTGTGIRTQGSGIQQEETEEAEKRKPTPFSPLPPVQTLTPDTAKEGALGHAA